MNTTLDIVTFIGLVVNLLGLLGVYVDNRRRQIQAAVTLEARLTAIEVWLRVLIGSDKRFSPHKNVKPSYEHEEDNYDG
ncbi:MAG: hypothetical protein OEZ39_20335 [Gammaproteobacteria bacterium]|nr:hypothetical protein [Gammaproteobacteria bacterium]